MNINLIQKIKDQLFSQDGADTVIITLTQSDYNELLKMPMKMLDSIEYVEQNVQFVVLPDKEN